MRVGMEIENLAFVYILSNDLKTTILNQDIMTLSNIVRSKTKKKQTNQPRSTQDFLL